MQRGDHHAGGRGDLHAAEIQVPPHQPRGGGVVPGAGLHGVHRHRPAQQGAEAGQLFRQPPVAHHQQLRRRPFPAGGGRCAVAGRPVGRGLAQGARRGAAFPGQQFAQDAQGDFLHRVAAQVQPSRVAQPCQPGGVEALISQRLAQGGHHPGPRHEGEVARLRRQPGPQHRGLALVGGRGDQARVGLHRQLLPGRGDDALCAGKVPRLGLRAVHGHRVAHLPGQQVEVPGQLVVSGDEQPARWKVRLDEHVHPAAAGHAHPQHLVVQVHVDDAGEAVLQGQQGLLAHQALRAAAAHPAEHVAPARVDDGLGARLGRGRTVHPDHRGHHERLPGRLQLADALVECLVHDLPSLSQAPGRAARSSTRAR